MTDRSYRLGDLIEVKHGFAFSGVYFSEDPSFPVLVTPGNFAVSGGFQERNKTFSGEVPRDFELRPGDLIVTMTDLSRNSDTLGAAALVPDNGRRYLHNQRIGKISIKRPDLVDAQFLSYYLRNASYRAHVVGTASGSTVRHTSPNRIEAFHAELPERHDQLAIAAVLGALEGKIAANEALARTADDLASASFTAMPRDVDTLLSSTAAFINGKAFTKDASGTGRVVVRIAELNSGIGGSTVYSDAQVADNFLVRPGDLLFAWSGSLTVQRWYRPEAIVNQHIFKVVPRIPYPMWLVYQLLRENLEEFRAIASDKATTMGHIQRHHLDKLVAIPESGTTEEDMALMEGLWKRALAAETENLTLAELRDIILPALMSGRLRVNDAERLVEDAV